MTTPSAISGVTDPSVARVVLYQSGRQVHAPALALGLMRQRTITGTPNKITVTNGDGVSGDPTITIPNAVTLVTPTVTGLLTVSGGGVAFPATQVASSNPNVLDDYEEGTFTPTIVGTTSAGVGTYADQVGLYVKIGGWVFYQCRLGWSAHTGTGNMELAGMPFVAAAGNQGPSSVAWNSLTYTGSGVVLFPSSSSAQFLIRSLPATGAALGPVAIDTAASVYFNGFYRV